MTIENETLREQLRALLTFRLVELPPYSADPLAQARVGKVLADTSGRTPVFPKGEPWR